MKAKLITLTLSMLMIATAFAQGPGGKGKGDRKEKREELEAQKVAFITTKLELTTEESEKFWPVYNERESELKTVRKDIREKVKEGKDLDSLSDADVKKMMEDVIKLKKQELDIEEKYNKKFQEVLPVKKVAKLHWAERKFNEEVLRAWKEKKGDRPHKPGDK